MWWEESDDATRQQLLAFLENGQWEFMGGCWAQNDEAVTRCVLASVFKKVIVFVSSMLGRSVYAPF